LEKDKLLTIIGLSNSQQNSPSLTGEGRGGAKSGAEGGVKVTPPLPRAQYLWAFQPHRGRGGGEN